MAGLRQIHQFLVLSPSGKSQSAFDVPMANADLTSRQNCEITVEDVVARRTLLDCEGKFPEKRTTDTRAKRFTFNYASVTPQIMSLWAGYFFGSATAPTGTPANEAQTLTRTGTVTGGTFTVSLTLEGRTGVSEPIAWNAANSVIQAALVKVGASIGKLIKAGDVVISGDWATAITATFGGRLANADLPLLVVNPASLTGTTPGITVAQTTAGANKYHEFANSTDDLKPYFSFALGFKTGGLATEKYYNAVCERFDPTANRNGDVGLTVSVVCNYEAVQVTGFSVPACASYDALKTADCRVLINSVWKTLDVFSQSITLNDNVPLDADTFGFDSVDPDSFERGDNPSYAITAQLFGVENDTTDALAVALRAEDEVPYITHFGMPGNRFTLIFPKVSIVPQSNSRQFAGARNRSVLSIDGLPLRDGAENPVSAESYISQATAFLLS